MIFLKTEHMCSLLSVSYVLNKNEKNLVQKYSRISAKLRFSCLRVYFDAPCRRRATVQAVTL